MSPESIRDVQRRYANIYVSFSTYVCVLTSAVNEDKRHLPEQIRACDRARLLSESDYGEWPALAPRTHAMVAYLARVLDEDATSLGAALATNFERYRNRVHGDP